MSLDLFSAIASLVIMLGGLLIGVIKVILQLSKAEQTQNHNAELMQQSLEHIKEKLDITSEEQSKNTKDIIKLNGRMSTAEDRIGKLEKKIS